MAPKGAVFVSPVECNVECSMYRVFPCPVQCRVELLKRAVLHSSCLALKFNHSWYNLCTKMVYVALTLLLCHSCCPEFTDPSDKFFLRIQLCVFANVPFQFMPQQFDRVQVRTFWRCFPPVYIVVSVKLLCVREVCFGSLSCWNLCAGSVFLMKGRSNVSSIWQ